MKYGGKIRIEGVWGDFLHFYFHIRDKGPLTSSGLLLLLYDYQCIEMGLGE